jgi:cold shock CspA family protein
MARENVEGKVKWFNSRAGYGFITVISEGEHLNEDIFVHHSGLCVKGEQYKYLVQGEYVEFVLTETNDTTHKFQADSVTGIKKNVLMCETRNLLSKRNTTNQSVPKKRRYTKNSDENEQASEYN